MATTKIKIKSLGWNGVENKTIEVEEFPRDILKVDDWCNPCIGELCFYKGKMRVVKNVYWHTGWVRLSDGSTDRMFKPHMMVELEGIKSKISASGVVRVYVKRGKKFTFRGKEYTYGKNADFEKNEEIALSNKITV